MDNIVSANREYIKSIIKFLKNKPTKTQYDDIICEFYVRLLRNDNINIQHVAKCIYQLLGYSAHKPGKVYIWPDNVIYLHEFVSEKCDIYTFSYPDEHKPNQLLWKAEFRFNKELERIETRKIAYKPQNITYSKENLRKCLDL
jgi:hypothetical protein